MACSSVSRRQAVGEEGAEGGVANTDRRGPYSPTRGGILRTRGTSVPPGARGGYEDKADRSGGRCANRRKATAGTPGGAQGEDTRVSEGICWEAATRHVLYVGTRGSGRPSGAPKTGASTASGAQGSARRRVAAQARRSSGEWRREAALTPHPPYKSLSRPRPQPPHSAPPGSLTGSHGNAERVRRQLRGIRRPAGRVRCHRRIPRPPVRRGVVQHALPRPGYLRFAAE
jgi:hypothetical protein